jgi:hypothetical protein
MVFKVSNITGKWYDENNIEVSLDTNTQEGILIDSWLKLGNQPILFDGTPEEIIQQQFKEQEIIKLQQHEELLPTDWYVIRFMETGIPIPQEIIERREEIRNRNN